MFQYIRWYGWRGLALFVILALLMGITQVWQPPVYSARTTARVGSQPRVAAMSPMAMLTSDNVEDELAVLESQVVRQHAVDTLFLQCKPVPAWQPNPLGYQIGRVLAFIFRTKRPLDYGKLDYPTTLSLDLNYDRMAKRKLFVEVDGQGSYALKVNGKTVDTQPVGEMLSTDGLSIALTGFTPDTAQRWRLKLTEPELAAALLRDSLTIMRVGVRSNTIGIKCDELHPGLAARIVNTIMAFYIARDVENKQQNSSEMLVYLDQRIAEVESEIKDHRETLTELLSDQKHLLASGESSYVADTYLTFQNRATALYTEKAQVKQLRDQLDTDAPFAGYYNSETVDRPVELEQAQAILNAERKLEEELLTKTEQHPDIVLLKQTIESRKGQLAELLDESTRQLDAQISSAHQGMGRYEELLELSPETRSAVSQASGDITIGTQVLGSLYAQRQQIALQKESDVSPIVILDAGRPNYKPASPRLMTAAFVSILFALLLTAALLVAGRILDTDVRDAGSLMGRNGAPLLAVVDSDGQPADEVEARRLNLVLAKLLSNSPGTIALVGATGSNQAEAVLNAASGANTGAKLETNRVFAASGIGEAALYDPRMLEASAVVLITTTGRRRLKQLAPMLSAMGELGLAHAGWILVTGKP